MTYESPQDPFVTSGHQQLAPKRRVTKPVVFLLAAAVAVIGVLGAVFLPKVIDASGVEKTETFEVRGTLELRDIPTIQAGCIGQGGYSDITGRDQVIVTDASGKTVAIGQIVKGTTDGRTCLYEFVVRDVPSGLGFYGVEVGKRGRVQYDEAQVRQGVKLSLGSK